MTSPLPTDKDLSETLDEVCQCVNHAQHEPSVADSEVADSEVADGEVRLQSSISVEPLDLFLRGRMRPSDK